MKILYGVQGTGNGHISRARAMAPALADQGLEVDYLFSGRPAERYFDMEPFGNFQLRHGMSFVVKNGRIDRIKTVKQAKPARFINEVRNLDLSGYDLVLTDFEPVTAWAAKLSGKRCIGISRQYAFCYNIPKVPSGVGQLVFSYYAPADIKLGCHWDSFGEPILPPIIESNPFARDIQDNLILVYLPFENLPDLVSILNRLTHTQFEVYHPDAVENKKFNNVCVFKPARQAFQQSMARCSGIIGNAGFELASEALHMGCPLLVKPLKGQVEQLSNVMNLKLLGLADSINDIESEAVNQWLEDRKSVQICYPDVASELAKWIAKESFDRPTATVQDLSNRVWSQVKGHSNITQPQKQSNALQLPV
ncbi:MAG: glycosyltransferase family protein [Pseudohongiella sp.]|nr:glycosyltransferase family protein [Pseudohongiella sp.]